MFLLLIVLAVLVLSGGVWAFTSNALALLVVVLLAVGMVGVQGRRYYRRRASLRDRV